MDLDFGVGYFWSLDKWWAVWTHFINFKANKELICSQMYKFYWPDQCIRGLVLYCFYCGCINKQHSPKLIPILVLFAHRLIMQICHSSNFIFWLGVGQLWGLKKVVHNQMVPIFCKSIWCLCLANLSHLHGTVTSSLEIKWIVDFLGEIIRVLH